MNHYSKLEGTQLEEGAEDGESWYDFVERVNLRFELERNREEGYACDMRKRCVFVQKEYQTLPRYIREREKLRYYFSKVEK